MKLSNIIEADTRRGFLKKAAGIAASLGSGNLLGAAKAAAPAAAVAAKSITPTILYQKILTKYLFPKMWNKSEAEVLRDLAPQLDIETLRHITDRDIVNGIRQTPLTADGLQSLLEVVIGPNAGRLPDWLHQLGVDTLTKIVGKAGPATVMKFIMAHEQYTLPHAMHRLAMLRSNCSEVAAFMNKAGLTNLRAMTPQKFDALERITGVRIDDAAREHYASHLRRVEAGRKKHQEKQQQPKTAVPQQQSDELDQWENEGGFVRNSFEESLNRVLRTIFG